MDSEANIQYLICECGDNFPNEKSLKEHCVQNHSQTINSVSEEFHVKLQEEVINEYVVVPSKKPAKKNSNTQFVRKPIYFITNNVVQEKIAVAPVNDIIESLEGHLEEHHAEEIMDDLVNMPIKVEATCKKEEQEEINYEYQSIVTSENRIIKEHNYDKTTLMVEYYCDMCGKSFDKEHHVKNHIQLQHLGEKLQCELCDAQFSRQHGLITHMNAKHGCNLQKPPKHVPKKFVCETCGNAFTSAAALKYHYRIHTGETPYACQICPKKFKMPLQLQIHIRTHTGEKPYPCDRCSKAFGNRGALWRHNKVHTGEKPYECPDCQKRFSQSNSMKLHIRTVHMKLPTPYKSKARRLNQAKISHSL